MNTTSHSNITPNDLDVLIHYYTTPGHHPRLWAPGVWDAVNKFIRDGVLVNPSGEAVQLDACGLVVSEMGVAWLKLMLNTPYPIQKWVDPRTETEVNGAR